MRTRTRTNNPLGSVTTLVRTSTVARLHLTEMAKADGISIAALVHRLAMAEWQRREALKPYEAEWQRRQTVRQEEASHGTSGNMPAVR